MLSSLPIQEPAIPLVESWLESLEDKSGAEKWDFTSMREKFVAHCFLEMDLDDLAALPHDDFGKKGFEFNLAEVSFLQKWLEVSMAMLRPKSGRGKRSKH